MSRCLYPKILKQYEELCIRDRHFQEFSKDHEEFLQEGNARIKAHKERYAEYKRNWWKKYYDSLTYEEKKQVDLKKVMAKKLKKMQELKLPISDQLLMQHNEINRVSRGFVRREQFRIQQEQDRKRYFDLLYSEYTEERKVAIDFFWDRNRIANPFEHFNIPYPDNFNPKELNEKQNRS